MKKTAVLLASLGMSAAALAGGHTAPSHNVAHSHHGFYADANMGYAMMDYSKDEVNSRSGFSYSFDLGYNLTDAISVEAGLAHVVTVKFDGDKGYAGGISLAAKYSMNVAQDIDLFGKAGIMYYVAADQQGASTLTTNRVAPLVAVGASYHLTKKVDLSTQLRTTFKSGIYKTTYAGLVGVGYRFG